jgi:diguanylate cyclase
VAEKIRTHIENTEFLHKGEQVKITISLGGTQVRNSDKSETLIFERADKALYKAKQSGRNAVVML